MAARVLPGTSMGANLRPVQPSSRLVFAAGAPRALRAAAPLRPGASAAAAAPQQQRRRQRLPVSAAAAGGDGGELVPDSEFALSKVSFGSILTPLGVGLLTYGFGAYFMLLPGSDLSSLMLIYGFPISVLGFALSYAQLEPVACKTTRAAFDLRESQMTDIQKQIREDTTRYRYGDEQHLEEALAKIFMYGRSGGVPKKNAPRLTGLREETDEGRYTLVLEFESKMEWEDWETRVPKIQSFFGPGIEARLGQTEKGIDVLLISDGSGEGRTGKERAGVLPPLMPGLKARQQ
ncbi:MAG: hypothetical protein J3K34DRAFT_375305 [Monoraphidium minutum]|nr:MAG: hypothetical protein J3K34DRAFT_375305 [Monoraphidium minutum]